MSLRSRFFNHQSAKETSEEVPLPFYAVIDLEVGPAGHRIHDMGAILSINGLQDPITRAESVNRVLRGDASLFYISPEMLRSKTVEKILLNRHVVRFVIDEAHCFSSWGQDFRVDYLYIGRFIRQYQEKKKLASPVPLSCFTATAKQKVIQDICDYFKKTLGLNLEIFASGASRTNLRYSVIHAESNEDKYVKLRDLIRANPCPCPYHVIRTFWK